MKKLEFESNGSKWMLMEVQAANFAIYKGRLVMGSTDLDVNNKCLKIDRGDDLGFYVLRAFDNGISLKTISEAQASEVVSRSIHTSLFAHYVKDIPVNTYCYTSPIQSLHSLIKSKGVWLFGNPVENWKDEVYFNTTMEEAEEKTFYNPILFKIIS